MTAVVTPGVAQEPGLALSPGAAENGWRAVVRPIGLLTDSALVRPLRSGLPLRFHFRLELWRDRFLADELVDRAVWSVILYQQPLSGQYILTRSWDPDNNEVLETLESARAALERWYRSPFEAPDDDGNYYYDARLAIEILSLGDLAELEHWLRGEAEGEGDVGGAIARGLKRLFIRVIGLSARTFEVRTETFTPTRREP